jgi:phosphopantothenoylcysteine decarboxylase/phosphopantothenate--cysteine ligase
MTSGAIVVGVGGGIAAYKVADVVSKLVQRGKSVRVVMTHNATKFVGAATFAALTSHPVAITNFSSSYPLGAHIELAENCSLLVVAPATARLLASCAHGLADNLLATLYLNCQCPVLMAPAMSAPMWDKPAVQRNVDQLRKDGVRLVGPEEGWLSCRKRGTGRMAEPQQILKSIDEILQASSN